MPESAIFDGKKGSQLGKVYGLCAQLDKLYKGQIDDLDEAIREKIHKIFMARWQYFHKDIMTAAYFFDAEHIHKAVLDETILTEVKEVLKKLTPEAHVGKVFAELAAFISAVNNSTNNLTDQVAFGPDGQKMPGHEWARIYLCDW